MNSINPSNGRVETNDCNDDRTANEATRLQTVYLVPLESKCRCLGEGPNHNDESHPKKSGNYSRPSETNEVRSLITNRIMPDKLNRKYEMVMKNRSIFVDFLAILFGIGTWIGINGTFIQLPLLVDELPEGWSLPSYLAVCVQIGNLGPLAYTLIQNFSKRKMNDSYIIYSLLVMGTISSLLTAFFYDGTKVVGGQEHSLALFILTTFTAFNACTSSVLFMPYMGRFKEIYLVTYFIGEGLSGLLPSVVSLIQGIGGQTECIVTNVTETGVQITEPYTPPPRFGTSAFFIFVFVMMVCSCIGFTLLDRLKMAKRQYAAVTVSNGNSYEYARDERANDGGGGAGGSGAQASGKLSVNKYACLLFLIGVISFFANGIFNSIQSYSALPYGSQAYHLSVTLSVIANPVACFLAVFLPHMSLRAFTFLTGFLAALTSYVMVTAAMSPLPPLHGTTEGSVLIIVVWTVLVGLVSYTKLSITSVMRSQGGKSLVWTGGLTQMGSLFGSVLIFVLINITKSFQDAPYEGCEDIVP